MMTLLRGFHAIAAQRGDGLRPEFLTMTAASPPWTKPEEIGDTSRAPHAEANNDANGKAQDASTIVVSLTIAKG